MAENISTINKPGEDYNTLTLWEAAKDGDITAGNAEVAECYADDGTLVDQVTVAGWITDSDSYVEIRTPAGERHNGTVSTGFRLKAPVASRAIILSEGYTRVTGLIIETDISNRSPIRLNGVDNVGDPQWISHCIIFHSGTNVDADGIWISTDTDQRPRVWDNIFYDFIGAGAGINLNVGGVCYAYNNTIHNCYHGIKRASGTLVAKNNIVNDNAGGGDYQGTFSALSTNNTGNDTLSQLDFGVVADSGNTDGIGADPNVLRDTGQNFLTTVKVGMVVKNTTDTTYSHVTSVNSDTQLTLNDDIMDDGENYTIYKNFFGSVVFENEGGDDFHLGSGDTLAKDNGTDLSTDPDGFLSFSDDIDGETRSGSWDIGADEFVAAASITKIVAETYQFSESRLRLGVSARVTNETYQLSEGTIRKGASTRLVNETVNWGEVVIRKLASLRIVAETLQLGEGIIRKLASLRLINETVQWGEGILRRSGFVKLINETLNWGESFIKSLVQALGLDLFKPQLKSLKQKYQLKSLKQRYQIKWLG